MNIMKRTIASVIISAGVLAPLASPPSAAATDCAAQAAATQSAASRFDAAMSDYLRLLGASQDARGRLQRARIKRRTARAVGALRREAAAARSATRAARQVAYRYGVAFRAEQAENGRCEMSGSTSPAATSSSSSTTSLDHLLALLSGSGASLAGMGTTATQNIPVPATTTSQENQLIELLNSALQGRAAAAGIPGPTYIVPVLLGLS